MNADEEEWIVLASAMQAPSTVPGLEALGVGPGVFSSPARGLIWSAMRTLYAADGEYDRRGVERWLMTNGTPDAVAAVERTVRDTPGMSVVRAHSQTVVAASQARRLRVTLVEAIRRVDSGSAPSAVSEDVERQLLDLQAGRSTRGWRRLADVLHDETERVAKLASGEAQPSGVPTGWTDLDELLGGWHPGQLIVIGARPGMGKSAFVTNTAGHVSGLGLAVGMFSLEMADRQIAGRLLADEGHIDSDRIRRGKVNDRELQRMLGAAQTLSTRPLLIDDTSDISVAEIRAKARRLRRDSGRDVGLLVVDYLQLIRHADGAENRRVAVGEMSRGLKVLARELDVPVIALSQLSRAVEQRTDKTPMLSDLRETGDIEQDADVVLFLYRPSYYDEQTRPGELDVICAKQREGRLDTVALQWSGEYQRVSDLETRRAA